MIGSIFFQLAIFATSLHAQISSIFLPGRYLDFVQVIDREEWGAEQEWLFSGSSEQLKVQAKHEVKSAQQYYEEWLMDQRVAYLNTYFSGEYSVDETVSNYFGHQLRWPLDYHFPKTKIFIHHSAVSAVNVRQTKIYDQMQEIQRMHSFNRNRGDIGYHFFVDKFGNIYEGRFGGPGVIAAHAQFNNFDSIGINLLGNYQDEYMSKDQFLALLELILALGKYYDIDFGQELMFHQRISTTPYMAEITGNALAYHKMVFGTACPGKHVIDYIPVIENFVRLYPNYFSLQNDFGQIVPGILANLDMSAIRYLTEDQLQNLMETYQHLYQLPSSYTTIGFYSGWASQEVMLGTTVVEVQFPWDEGQHRNLIGSIDFLQSVQSNCSFSDDELRFFVRNYNEFLYRLINFSHNATSQNSALFWAEFRKLFTGLGKCGTF